MPIALHVAGPLQATIVLSQHTTEMLQKAHREAGRCAAKSTAKSPTTTRRKTQTESRTARRKKRRKKHSKKRCKKLACCKIVTNGGTVKDAWPSFLRAWLGLWPWPHPACLSCVGGGMGLRGSGLSVANASDQGFIFTKLSSGATRH